MTSEIESQTLGRLHPLALQLVDEWVHDFGPRIQVVRDDAQGCFAVEETSSTNAFAEVKTHEMRLAPVLGEPTLAQRRAYVVGLERTWTDNERELVVDLSQGRK